MAVYFQLMESLVRPDSVGENAQNDGKIRMPKRKQPVALVTTFPGLMKARNQRRFDDSLRNNTLDWKFDYVFRD